ncbi:MAG: TSUP family transporter [Gammaproteobacteria bacterium]|nr:TSUP family transporter [Gammaproteobacteria bacterium]
MISWLGDLSIFHYLFLMVIIAFAGLVHGTMGIGFPMVATPLIAVFMDVRLAILLTLLPTATVNLASIWGATNYKKILRDYRWLFSSVWIGAIGGSYLLVVFDPAPFRLALAVLIMVFLVTTMSNRLSLSGIRSENFPVMLVFGLAAGVSGGTTNVMVAVLIIYLLGIGLKRLEMIPILNTCFLIGKSAQIEVLTMEGFINSTLIYQTIPLSGMALVSLLYGKKIGEKISVEGYRIMLYVLLLVLACTLSIQFFSEM